jgi:DNA-binding response OmpR family regulator
VSRHKILIVDDEADLVTMIKLRLEAAGYDTLEAYNGQEALKKVRDQNPGLIILDLMLPKMNGYKVCRTLKFDEKYRHIPIIIFTAKVQDTDKQMGQKVGADAYITKPFEPDILLAKIRELLSQHN